ncbi:MAG: penicillin-binding protein 1A MrcA [Bacteroidetes bacterium HLUCCA01]|nr:MAG: penicillin-binding protein 1A MrcA [Bacteroidetes bacterium HLUCCA01]
MSDKNPYNDEYERYLNDPEYRKQKKAEREAKNANINRSSGAIRKPKPNRKPGNSESVYRFMFRWTGILLLLSLIGGVGFVWYLLQGLPSIEELENPQTDIASFVLSRDGEVLDKYFTENRTYVPYNQISHHVIDALIAVEDHRFYDHWGIDMYRTAAVPIHLLRGNLQGGSTITQQLARNLYRKIGRRVTVVRKLREMLTAVQIERNYTKREILEMYLNTVEFSNSSHGIEAAAFTHYGKSAADLNVTEAATLIGSLNNPTLFNPRTRNESSTRRRNVVLSQMARRGFISENDYLTSREEPILLNYNPPFRARRESRYFGEYIRLQIQDWADENGYDLFTDGLVIYTTVESNMQRIAERVVRDRLAEHQIAFEREWTSPGGDYMDRYWERFPTHLDQFLAETTEYQAALAEGRNREEALEYLKQDEAFVDEVKRSRTQLESSFVALDPRNGQVLAWVGGTDYGRRQFDQVFMARKQVGSTFKPFVYALAIDNGYKPYHRFSRYPISFIDNRNQVWDPKDATVSPGPEMVSLSEGLARSLNNVTVRLLPELAGTPGTNRLEDLMPAGRRIAEMAYNLGVRTSPILTYPSIALGTAELTLLEMTSAYSTFANQGVYIEPTAVTRIEDKAGNVLVDFFPQQREEVISPETAYIMIDMMRGVIRGGDWGAGTGVRMRIMGVTQDVAGKTGTTQNSADNWFIAVMPHIAIGSWVGGDDRRIRFPSSTGIGQGARTALPIVADFIIENRQNNPDNWSLEGFEQPAGYVEDIPGEARQEQNQRNTRRTGW